ncbi:hypothetical protein D9611_000280 [Ephemerocybe angulata]|uniref:Uncharacterized protein n=1 Tax=Ephemerocybe angulata TaxID=980116 RepID=A0A8H5BMH1_9AGAR|nr:hypothetical protein D9611_000280 [Tulosesus angulatus]
MNLPRIARLAHPVSFSCRRSFTSASRLLTRGAFLSQHRPLNGTLLPGRRLFSDKPETPKTEQAAAPATGEQADYVGPLSSTFRKLKIFSLASCGLSVTLAPFMFLVESNLPYSARLALASIAIGTSGLSTSLVAWCARPYVTTLGRLKPEGEKGGEVLQLTTMTLTLRHRVTTVYDPEFLIETRRPMAKWELASQMTLPASRLATEGKSLVGTQETVAETVDHTGKIIGRWIVTWGENGEGVCHQAGHVVKYFNVHEELLS